MKRILNVTPLSEIGVFVAKLSVGFLIMRHGLPLFDRVEMQNLSAFLRESGFVAPVFMAHLAKATEFFGGILLGLGLLTRIVCPMLAFTMFVIVWKMGDLDFLQQELPTLFLLFFLLFFFHGSGKWSLDRWISEKWVD
ncbi:DoxX family membrane protein [Flavobacterium sp. MAH-1]|uniref:DoxX family membrane protein n=1 Tax=Flavobacterium agri TaxID=2743471 RepID=A0A7Y9C3X2_9FLAO|nr:DoxX family membrane protein [Flavobacterium agri]NUY79546.1 DoxX family membrane protein [Flavobacterium agri]NYA69571.1 DoxX family membrane protein [Flavobacterium agri]